VCSLLSAQLSSAQLSSAQLSSALDRKEGSSSHLCYIEAQLLQHLPHTFHANAKTYSMCEHHMQQQFFNLPAAS
jgi:hypothetical protein